eukprot:7654322-Ditylum_brightwellii.AAC.1
MGGCSWPISFNTVLNSSPLLQFTYNPPTSASAAEHMTLWIVLHSLFIAPLSGMSVELFLLGFEE